MIFFQRIFFINQFIIININLHQSSAGMGSKLKTHRFILIIAHNIIKKINHPAIEFVIKSTIQIGQLTCLIASLLSSFVLGLNIFLIKIFNPFNVKRE